MLVRMFATFLEPGINAAEASRGSATVAVRVDAHARRNKFHTGLPCGGNRPSDFEVLHSVLPKGRPRRIDHEGLYHNLGYSCKCQHHGVTTLRAPL